MIWTTPQPCMKVGHTLRMYHDNVMYHGGVHDVYMYAIQVLKVMHTTVNKARTMQKHYNHTMIIYGTGSKLRSVL